MDFLSEIIQNIVVFVEQIGSIILTAIAGIGEFFGGDFFTLFLIFFLGAVTLLFCTILTIRLGRKYQTKLTKLAKPTTLTILAILMLAFFSYNLPQKYQLANLTQNHQNNQPQVAGETQDNQGLINQTPTENLFALKESHPNLYQLLTSNIDRRPSGTSLQLGMLSINPQGQLFILPKSISSREIKNHEVKNQDMADNSITSTNIKNHTIRSIDLQRELTIEELKINQNLTVRGNLTTQGSLTAVDMNLSGNLDLQDNLILNIGNANTDFTTTGGLNLASNLNINNQFLVDATSGNVGIGTTSPATIFHINQPSDSNGLRLTRLGGTAGLYASFEIVNGATTPYLNIGVQDNSASRNIIFAASGGGNIGIGSTGPGARLQVVGADSLNTSFAANIAGATGTGLIVTNSGNVGIGTTSPIGQLGIQVSSDAKYAANILNAGGTNVGGLFINSGGGSELYLKTSAGVEAVKFSSTGTNYITSGNVGIGTTAPGAKLDVWNGKNYLSLTGLTHGMTTEAPTATYGYMTNTGATGGLKISGLTSGDVNGVWMQGAIGVASPTAAAIVMQAAKKSGTTLDALAATEQAFGINNWGTRLVTVLGNGNVGIGTTSPTQKLDVATGNIGILGTAAIEQYGLYYREPTVNAMLGGISFSRTAVSNAPTDIIFYTNKGNNSSTIPSSANEVMRIINSGNVGIGTTGPYSRLHVSGGNLSIDNNRELDFLTAAGTSTSFYMIATDSLFSIQKNGGSNPGMFMNSSGNVGIGTTGPGYKLDVSGGDIAIEGSGKLWWPGGGVYLTESGGIKYVGNATHPMNVSGAALLVGYAGDGATSYAAGNALISGNVGIGTTGPDQLLDVRGNIALGRISQSVVTRFFGMTDTNGAISGGTGMFMEQIADGKSDLRFQTNNWGTGYGGMILKYNGNVGIGTVSPGAELQVNSGYFTTGSSPEIRLGDSATYWSVLYGDLVKHGAYFGHIFEVNGDEKMRIAGSGLVTVAQNLVVSGTGNTTIAGNVGIGTTNPTHKIMLSGGAYSDGVNWTDVSDRNLKTNFITLDPQTVLTKIVALPITQWNYKTESANIKHIGTMAQDFYAQFGLGGVDGNTSISAMDTGGVALLGIQALNTKTNNFITQSSNQIEGLTENQNKIVEQLTGQLANQDLTVDTKLQLIGASLDELTTKQIEKIKDQITVQTSDITALKKQMADIQTNMYLERYDELWSFYQNFELAKVPLKNALENVFDGKITASDIEALNKIKATDIEATNSLKGQNLELGAQVSGTSAIKAGELESAKILTTEAQAGIKLYITPKGSTQGKTLFYDESDIDSGVGFRVKIDAPALDKDVEFNWLIVK